MPTLTLSGTSTSFVDGSFHFYTYYSSGLLNLCESGQSLLARWPAYAQGGRLVRAMNEAIGREFERFNEAQLDVQNQLSVYTATWGLKYWEQYVGLPVQSTTDWDVRRGKILVRLFSSRQESEYYFYLGLDTLAGGPPVITYQPPRTVDGAGGGAKPYTVKVEIPQTYYHDDPAGTITGTPSSGGSLAAGTYTYRASFLFKSGETLASATSSNIVVSSGSSVVALSNVPLSSDPDWVATKIYRKKSTDSSYTLVGSTTASTFGDPGTAGTDAALLQSTALTGVGAAVKQYIEDTKPAHIHVDVSSTGFRADISHVDIDHV